MENSGMYYLNLMLRYWFVIVVFAVLTGITSYFFQTQQSSLYQSQVSLFVGNALSSPDPELSSFESAERLALTYAQLIQSFQFLNLATEDIEDDIDIDSLAELISVNVISDTSILVVQVRDTDPERAAVLANTIANTLIVQTPSTLTVEQTQQLERIQNQINSLESLIEITETQHATSIAEEEFDTATELTNQLNTSYSTLAGLENEYQTLSNQISNIQIIDSARADFEPLGLNPLIVALAGSFLGIVIAVSAIIILDVFDTTLRTEEDITASIDAPLIGKVVRQRIPEATLQEIIATGEIVQTNLNAQYRTILSNILFAMNSQEDMNNMFVVTSPQTGNGRTITVINLAFAAIEAGLKVLVVDGDAHNPKLHEYMGIDNNQYALSRLLSYLRYNPDALGDVERVEELHNKVVRRFNPNDELYVIPAGRPADQQKRTIPLLKALKQFLDSVKILFEYDIIIIDTSAIEVSSDAVNLVAVTNSRILLVLEAKGTTEATATKTAGDLRRMGLQIDGIIMN